MTQLSLPDNQTVSFGYDGAGRSSTIALPTGTLQSGYDPSSGTVLTLSSPGGVTLTYSYDGLLPTGVSWSGPITGSVGYEYNNDFAPAEVSVNGTSLATFAYDNDGLLTTAGQLAITRGSQTGLITGTTVGGITTTLTHDGFGELTSQTATFGGDTLYQAAYTRDNGGRITGLTETARGVTTVPGSTQPSVHHPLERVAPISNDALGALGELLAPLVGIRVEFDPDTLMQAAALPDVRMRPAMIREDHCSQALKDDRLVRDAILHGEAHILEVVQGCIEVKMVLDREAPLRGGVGLGRVVDRDLGFELIPNVAELPG